MNKQELKQLIKENIQGMISMYPSNPWINKTTDTNIIHPTIKEENSWLPKEFKGEYSTQLVKSVATELDFEATATFAFVVDLLEYINAHNEAKEVNNILDRSLDSNNNIIQEKKQTKKELTTKKEEKPDDKKIYRIEFKKNYVKSNNKPQSPICVCLTNKQKSKILKLSPISSIIEPEVKPKSCNKEYPEVVYILKSLKLNK